MYLYKVTNIITVDINKYIYEVNYIKIFVKKKITFKITFKYK